MNSYGQWDLYFSWLNICHSIGSCRENPPTMVAVDKWSSDDLIQISDCGITVDLLQQSFPMLNPYLRNRILYNTNQISVMC